MEEKNEKKSIEEVKSSVERKVREEVESLLGTSLEEISGGAIDADAIEDEKNCECIAFAKA